MSAGASSSAAAAAMNDDAVAVVTSAGVDDSSDLQSKLAERGVGGGIKYIAGGLMAVAAKYGVENSVEAVRARRILEDASRVGDFSLPRSTPLGDLDTTDMEVISMDTPLGESNVGFRLLQKMGWKTNTGLGRTAQGIVAPVRLSTEQTTLGLGKATQIDETSVEATKQRKALELEIQSVETADMKAAREAVAERERAIKSEVTAAVRVFLCKDCNKQYVIAEEYERHLDSYDHHHLVRMRATKLEQSQRVASERTSRELRKASRKEDKLLKAQMDAAAAAASGGAPKPATASLTPNSTTPNPAPTAAAAPPTLPPTPQQLPPPPPPSPYAALSPYYQQQQMMSPAPPYYSPYGGASPYHHPPQPQHAYGYGMQAGMMYGGASPYHNPQQSQQQMNYYAAAPPPPPPPPPVAAPFTAPTPTPAPAAAPATASTSAAGGGAKPAFSFAFKKR